jgi:hypothetical protein
MGCGTYPGIYRTLVAAKPCALTRPGFPFCPTGRGAHSDP